MLSVVNHLFGAEFGEEFQPLAASGEFPDPVFGTPVELLVTDKAAYADSGVHWRRAEARHVARRVKELVDSGAASAGEIVLLFAAGTDAEWYEEELREAGLADLPRDRPRLLRPAAGRRPALVPAPAPEPLRRRGARLRARLAVRRRVERRAPADPAGCARRRSSPASSARCPPDLDERDVRLLRAFRQRYDRLVEAAARLSLERLCERIVADHDYDLAVLAQWDGRRRYANLRKLARIARSYEELRGPDLEGFVRFVEEQEAVGAAERDAVAEEEGADAVRLLTIHGAKGLEFKVVVVADAGRDRNAPSADEILCLSDGRFGFRVADPVTGKRHGVLDYENVKEARAGRGRGRAAAPLLRRDDSRHRPADRLRLDRLAPQGRREDADRLGARPPRLRGGARGAPRDAPIELEREGARVLVRVDRTPPAAEPARASSPSRASGRRRDRPARALLAGAAPPLPPLAPVLAPIQALPEPPLHDVRRLSYSALALFERCSYRYYAERVAGMRPADAHGTVAGQSGLVATEVGDAVHRLLELVDLTAPTPPDVEQVRAWYPAVTDEELARIAGFVASYCGSELAAGSPTLSGARPERPFAFEHDGVLLHGRLDVLHRDGTRALVLDYKTNTLAEGTPEEIVEADYRLQRLVYALACFRAGAEEVEVVYHFLERPDAVVSTTFARADTRALEAELSEAIARIRAGEFCPPRASSSAPPARRSTSSAPGRGCAPPARAGRRGLRRRA